MIVPESRGVKCHREPCGEEAPPKQHRAENELEHCIRSGLRGWITQASPVESSKRSHDANMLHSPSCGVPCMLSPMTPPHRIGKEKGGSRSCSGHQMHTTWDRVGVGSDQREELNFNPHIVTNALPLYMLLHLVGVEILFPQEVI